MSALFPPCDPFPLTAAASGPAQLQLPRQSGWDRVVVGGPFGGGGGAGEEGGRVLVGTELFFKPRHTPTHWSSACFALTLHRPS